MKPDYKNWMPKGMVLSFAAGAVICLIGTVASAIWAPPGWLKTLTVIILAAAAAVLCGAAVWCFCLYRAFSYNGKRRLSKTIIEGTAGYIRLPDGGRCLDVGCGSGALTIAAAKRFPKADVVGIDRWGKEYSSFSKALCESNAKAEGVKNVSFLRGDALRLDFADETFDAVTSNYVYHNIPSSDRQAILLETLRTLKKGGSFAIHDIFSRQKYGDMDAFVKKLRDMGYRQAELIGTAEGKWIGKREAAFMGLSGSALLYGIK